jgi:hypothetical protein
MNRTFAVALFATFTAAATTQAQNPGAQQSSAIPIRQLTPAVATDSGVLSSVWGINALPGNRLMVNDFIRKRVIIFDETLKRFTTVMDSAAGAPANYSTSISPGLVPYFGDSTLLVDRSSTAFLVVAPNGKLGGILSPPKASDIYAMSTALLDAKGRLLFRGFRRAAPGGRGAAPPPAPVAIGQTQIGPAGPDSAPILRGDFDARTVDTVGMIHISATKSVMTRTDPALTGGIGGFGGSMNNPLPLTDEWTLLPDGTIAIVRGQDYHIDWIAMDGKMTSTPKMPFDWKRITLEEKQQIIDSVKSASNRYQDSLRAVSPTLPTGQPRFFLPAFFVEPAELPDYYPPVRAGQVKADYEGNVWILPATSTLAKGGLLYDVVNRKGEIIERVQFPPGRTLIAFGRGGDIYMSPASPLLPTSGPSITSLERATVIRPAGAVIKP